MGGWRIGPQPIVPPAQPGLTVPPSQPGGSLSDRAIVNYPGGTGDTAWLVTSDDSMIVGAASNQPGEVITVNIRVLRGSQWWTDSFTIDVSAGDRQLKTHPYDFSQVLNQFGASSCAYPSYLSDVSMEASIAQTRGQTWVRANLFRRGHPLNDGNTSPQPKCALLSDYITTKVTACLRNARHFTSTEGEGNPLTLPVANPGPGLDWSLTIPSNARWRVKSLAYQFVTSAAAGNRFPTLIIAPDGLNDTWETHDTIAPSIVNLYNYAPNVSYNQVTSPANVTAFYVPIPEVTLLGGGFIRTSTAGMQAGDVYSHIVFSIEEWIDNV